jgi:hypothetical protein
MPYTIDKEAKIKQLQSVPDGEWKVWQAFVANIHNGDDPKTAATKAYHSANYKNLRGPQWQFNLGSKNRVTFRLDGTTLRQVQVGGHT